MLPTLPAEVEVIDLPDGIHYRLPPRDLGALRWLGIPVIAFGIFIVGFIGFGVWEMAQPLLAAANDPFAIISIAFLLTCFFLAMGGYWFVSLGLFILGGHAEFELRGGVLRAIERFGPIRRARQLPIRYLRRFVVGPAHSPDGMTTANDGPFAHILAIRPHWTDDAPRRLKRIMLLAPGYPRDWLVPLAEALARQGRVAEPGSSEVVAVPPVEVVAVPPSGFVELPEQPASSRALVQRRADGVTVTVPPLGLRHGPARPFLFISLIWCGLVTLISLAALLSDAKPPDKGGQEMPDWGGLIVFGLSASAGIALLLTTINLGRRQAVLAVAGDELHILQTGLFGTSRQQWPRQQVFDVRVGPSKINMNRQPLPELQILPHLGEGKKFGLLAGRDEAELRWLATLLRQALGVVLSPETGLPPFHERPEQPPDSIVLVETSAGGVTLTIPPEGIWRGSQGMFPVGLVWSAVLAVVTGLFASDVFQGLEPPMLFGVFFWTMGLGLVVGGVYMGRRQAVLAVVADRLLVLQTSVFGSKRREWPREAVADIRTGPCFLSPGATDSTEGMYELQIHLRHGKPGVTGPVDVRLAPLAAAETGRRHTEIAKPVEIVVRRHIGIVADVVVGQVLVAVKFIRQLDLGDGLRRVRGGLAPAAAETEERHQDKGAPEQEPCQTSRAHGHLRAERGGRSASSGRTERVQAIREEATGPARKRGQPLQVR